MTKQKLVRHLIALGCLLHMAAVVAHNLPADTALGDPRRFFASYARLSFVYQRWAMFTTIPHYVALKPALVAKYADGVEKVYGPILPGLRPISDKPRGAYLLVHTVWPDAENFAYTQWYLARACDAMAAREHRRPISIAMRLDAVRVIPLAQVRKTGRIGKGAREWSKWHKC